MLLIIVFKRQNGVLSSFDDRRQSSRLPDLNRKFTTSVTQEERQATQQIFRNIRADDKTERHWSRTPKNYL